MARLGGVPQNHVLNAMPPPDITRFLRRKRRSFASLMSYRWLLSPSRESWWQSPPAARLSRSIGRKNHDCRSAARATSSLKILRLGPSAAVELSGLRTLNRFRRPEPETAAVAPLIIGVEGASGNKAPRRTRMAAKQHCRGWSGDWRLV